MDLPDLCHPAFKNAETDRDPVSFERRYGGGDLHPVFSTADILAFKLLFGAFQVRAVEDPRLGQADLPQRLFQPILGELLGTGDIDLRDGGPFFDYHHQNLSVGLEPHVAEESCGEERFYRTARTLLVDRVAHPDRKIGEDGTRFGALNSLDTDVADFKGLECERGKTE
jgi:hypothetical protein